jgi:predicted Zn-dependent protease
MKFVPKPVDDDVNIPDRAPIRDFLWLGGGMVGLLLASYVVVGLLVDLVVPHVTPAMEKNLAQAFTSAFQQAEPTSDPRQIYLQKLVHELGGQDYQVHLIEDDDMVNAGALPGGNILVYTGLLAKVRSENELSFILGHEIGHLQQRDHLRGLGRALVIFTAASLLMGPDNPVNSLVEGSLKSAQLSFSRQQELSADRIGLRLVENYYGHAGGASDFFQRLARENKSPWFEGYVSTHPHPAFRADALAQLIRTHPVPPKLVKPLPLVLR